MQNSLTTTSNVMKTKLKDMKSQDLALWKLIKSKYAGPLLFGLFEFIYLNTTRHPTGRNTSCLEHCWKQRTIYSVEKHY